MRLRYSLAVAVFAVLHISPALAHIDLLSPTPLLDGRAQNMRALKTPPFGAPGVDVAAAPATRVAAGSELDIELDIYVFHPGNIVVSWTRDIEGADVEPIYQIESRETAIPHANMLARVPIGITQAGPIRTTVRLPDVEGTIILVVRQVMFDKMDDNPDGSVSLSRVYYHQAAKLELVRE